MKSPNEHITLWKEDDWFVIRHEPSGVTTQGKDRIHALMMLADALAGYNDSHTVSDLQEMADDVYSPDYSFMAELVDGLEVDEEREPPWINKEAKNP